MRSLLAKSSITIFIMLALGSGLTVAATSSKPGMFLYPIKQTTQKFTGATGSPAKSLTPVVGAPQEGPLQEGALPGEDQQPPANVDSPSEATQVDGAEVPEVTDAGQANETIATPAPTPVRVVDEITVNTGPDAVPGGGSQTIDNASGPAAIEQLGSGYVDDSGNDNSQAEGSQVGNLDDGRTGKKEKSTDNDNNSSHSDSGRDNESNNNGEDHDE